MKLLIIASHLSTGGSPQYLLDYLKTFKNSYSEIKIIEFTNFSSDFVIQKNKLKELIGEENVICLGEYAASVNNDDIWLSDKMKLIPILDDYNPDIVWMNEFPEAYDYKKPPHQVMEYLYREDRPYKIIETTHYNSFNFLTKQYIPDEFMFCSNTHIPRSSHIDIPKTVWETPMNMKTRPDRDSTLKILGLDPNYYHILNVGLFHDNKNQKYIYDLSDKFKDKKVMFHFIGNECFLDSCGINNLDNPNCKRWGERFDVETFMSCMDLYLFPSKKELNPITVREAISHNMDIIVNRDEYTSQYDNIKDFNILDETNVEEYINSKLGKKFLMVCSFYNKEMYQIKRTIDSVISQKYNNWELIVGDDFSENNCKENLLSYIKEVNNSKITFYDIKYKRELYLYQNFFKEKEYDYYFDLDSDDIIDNNLLFIYNKHFKKYKDVHSIFCDLSVTDDNGKIERYYLIKPSQDPIDDFDLRDRREYMGIWEERSSWNMYGTGRCFKRSKFDKFEIGKNCRTSTDSMVLFNVLIEGNHLHIPMNLYTYERRVNSDSMILMSNEEHEDYNINAKLAIDKYKGYKNENTYLDVYKDIYYETSAIIMSGFKENFSIFSDINDDQRDKLKFLYPDIKFNNWDMENVVIVSNNTDVNSIIKKIGNKNISVYRFFDDFSVKEEELEDYFKNSNEDFTESINLSNYRYFHYFRHTNLQKDKEEFTISNIIEVKENEIIIEDFDGIKVEIIGNNEEISYLVEFIDKDNQEVLHSGTINSNMWIKPSIEYFINWEIKINGEIVYEQNLENKRVLIEVSSSSLGDTIAWFPYVLEFQKKHKCQVVVSTFKNWLFENSEEYKEIEFLKKGETYNNIHKKYNIGWFYDNDEINYNKNKSNFREIPLQQCSSDILGLKYESIRPSLSLHISDKRPIKGKYICISIHSTAQPKYWNYPNGWQLLTNHFKSLGYKVVLLSRENNNYMGNKHPSGVLTVSRDLQSKYDNNYSTYLKHCDFFIGTGTGISWISWALNTPTALISGFSDEISEFSKDDDNVVRIINKSVCNGCFNTHKLDSGDWNWCPLHKGTSKQFECTETITPEMVINQLMKFTDIDNYKPLEIEETKRLDDGFDWGLDNDYGKDLMYDEIFVRREYEKFFEVEEGDIVADFGSSVGPFSFSILHKNPSKLFCFEPSKVELETLKKNVQSVDVDVTVINKAIGNETINGVEVGYEILLDRGDTMDMISFEDFLIDYNIDKIDFLKTDCEGGEYGIFTEKNLPWIKNNVKKMSGEWHLGTQTVSTHFKEKFKHFRDNILTHFDNYEVYSIDGIDIKWDLFNDHFLNFYTEVFVYIDNR